MAVEEKVPPKFQHTQQKAATTERVFLSIPISGTIFVANYSHHCSLGKEMAMLNDLIFFQFLRDLQKFQTQVGDVWPGGGTINCYRFF